MVTPGVLDPDDLRAIAEQFGVADEQVRRDHLISHVLAAIGSVSGIVFYGGTALTRTMLPDLRLSEDIDLMTDRPRSEVARELVAAIDAGLARSFGEVRWSPALTTTRDAQPAILEVAGRLAVQVQLVAQRGRAIWPTQRREIEQRYRDAPWVQLECLTDSGFAAAKISAWLDRSTCRDLFDLNAIIDAGLIESDAATLVKVHTNWTRFPDDVVWPRPPSEEDWLDQLGHQTRLHIRAHDAYKRVVAALSTL